MTTASRREERRLLQQDVARTQLLDAAEAVFGAKGFHDATLKEVAELAEYSVGSVYSFFESKDDLFVSVFLRRGAEFVPGMEAAVAAGATAREQLHRLVDFEVGFFRAHPDFGRLFLRTGGSSLPTPGAATASDELAENVARAMRVHAAVFEEGQRTGELRAGSSMVLARMLSGLVLAFQAVDPAVEPDAPGAGTFTLDELHALIDDAFATPGAGRS